MKNIFYSSSFDDENLFNLNKVDFFDNGTFIIHYYNNISEQRLWYINDEHFFLSDAAQKYWIGWGESFMLKFFNIRAKDIINAYNNHMIDNILLKEKV